jgi:hypothetical protein
LARRYFVMSHTILRKFRITTGALAMALSLWFSGCGDNAPPQTATLTFKRDGSHFTGTVVRKEPNSITVTGAAGDTHTFLYAELSDIRYATPEPPVGQAKDSSPSTAKDSGGSGTSAASNSRSPQQGTAATTAPQPAGSEITLPTGSEFPVRSNGFLDSCCVPRGALALGVMDEEVKGPGGKVAIPKGASVLFELVESKKAGDQITMVFQLASADFGGHHYRIGSSEGAMAPGARLTLTGAKENSPEGRARGTNIHVDDQGFILFKAVSPITIRPTN